MRRAVLTSITLGLLVAACAVNMGAPDEQELSTVALRADAGATPAAVAATLEEVRATIALVAAPEDPAWFSGVAEAADLHLSGPTGGDLSLALMAMEPVGDTVIDLTYDGGTIRVVDALYDLDKRHFLDLMAFQVRAGDPIQPMVTRLLRYIATDVDPSAGVVLAIAVPDVATGDSIARLLSPGYFDTLRCAGAGRPEAVIGEIRLFYGPEARVWCRDAAAESVVPGVRIHAELVAGLRL